VAEIYLFAESLPADAKVRRFSSDEGISKPYRMTIEFATEDTGFDVKTLLRHRAGVTLVDANGRQRHLDGFVERAQYVHHTGTQFHFRVDLVPLLQTLAHREDSRIFQDKNVKDIVAKVLEDAGIPASGVEWRLQAEYPPREFVVQYRETDLNFVQRQCEDEGIYFFFQHSAEAHVLVFADHADAFKEQDGLEKVRFGMFQSGDAGTAPLAVFARRAVIRPTDVLIRDFDHVTPQVRPESVAAADGPIPLRVYEYPGGLRTADGQGERRAKARLSELRRDADTCLGESEAIGLCPGIPFSVAGASEPCNGGDFITTELTMRGEQGVGGDSNIACKNAFEAIPVGGPFAPPRRAKRPRIRGLQTAIVTGPSGEQQAIHCDELGRIKVRFHWDRAGVGDDKSSSWLRVAQTAIGNSMVIPRVGWEVAVAFECGDPNRPFVVARLYNGKHQPMFDVAGKATCGSFKSMASPGAGKSNEFGMDDAGGSQGMNMSGGKDMNTFVAADRSETVAVDESHSVTANLSSTVGGTETVNVGANQNINVGNALQVGTGGAQSISVGGNDDVGVEANYIEAIGGTRGYSIGGNRITISNGVRTMIDGAMTRDVGALQVNIAAGAINDGLGASYTETVGAVKAELIRGDSAENVAGAKSLTSTAAELHMVKNLSLDAASVKRLVGGVHLTKCGGDYEVSAPEIAIVGAVGHFKGGGASLKLNGGPIVGSGANISLKAGLITITAGSLKLQ
jgi:type VI secretion system secreted protein VgrG